MGTRNSLTLWGVVLGLLLAGTGCIYDGLSTEGKQCDYDKHWWCPSGTTCSPGGEDGTYICKANVPDAGPPDGDGGTDQTGPCTEGKKRCTVDTTKIETCEEGSWIPSDCGTEPPTYCLEIPTIDAACVEECTVIADCPTGFYCHPWDHHCKAQGNCSPPGKIQCSVSITNQLDQCDPESLYWEIYQTCTSGAQYCDFNDNSCKDFCTDDTECQAYAGTSCDLTDSRCYPMGLCTGDGDCSGGQKCWAGACLVLPTTPADNGMDPPTVANLDCFLTPSNPPATPATCALEGSVTEMTLLSSVTTVGLTVRVHRLADILNGKLTNPIDEVQATEVATPAPNHAFYHFDTVPTNEELVLEVKGGTGTGNTYVSMYSFGIYLRADDCASQGNVLTQNAPAMDEDLYNSYTSGSELAITPIYTRGLLFGVAQNCGDARRIRFATAGLSRGLENSRLYYFDHAPTFDYIPDPDATDTNGKGYFVVSNVKAIRGVASVVAMKDDNPLDIRLVGNKPVRVFAHQASMVFFGAWKNPTP